MSLRLFVVSGHFAEPRRCNMRGIFAKASKEWAVSMMQRAGDGAIGKEGTRPTAMLKGREETKPGQEDLEFMPRLEGVALRGKDVQVRENRREKASGRTMGNIPLPDPHWMADSSCPGHWPRLLKKLQVAPVLFRILKLGQEFCKSAPHSSTHTRSLPWASGTSLSGNNGGEGRE